MEICEKKQIYIGRDELIGAKGEKPSSLYFSRADRHSVEDLNVLNSREQQRYLIGPEDIETYARK